MNAHLPSRRLALAGAFSAVVLAGCSSAKDPDSSSSGGEDVQKRLKSAQSKLGSTAGYHVKLTSSGTPDQETSLKSGEGDVVTSPASFKGKVTANTGGKDVNLEVVSIGDENWVKPGFSPKYVSFDPADVGVPAPTKLFSATNGLPALSTLSKDMKKSGEKLVNGEKVTLFKGTVEAVTATKALNFGRTTKEYTVEVGLTEKDEMRSMTINGPFFDFSDVTYNLELTKYGQKVTITKPS